MKKTILIAILTAALLCGCAAVPDTTEDTDVPATSTSVQALPEGYYAPESPLQQQTGGAVRVYPLDIPDCYGVAAMDGDILIFSGSSGSTQLTLLRGAEAYPAAVRTVDTQIDAKQPSTQVTGEGLSFFDDIRRETVILDEALREITRISAPEGLSGAPLLSSDWLTMYYCTGEGVWAMDLETRIPRLLRQHTEPLTTEALLLSDTVLQCSEEGTGMLFCDTQTGQTLHSGAGNLKLVSSGERYIAVFNRTEQADVIFGTGIGVPQMLYTDAPADCVLLPESNAVLYITEGETLQLAYYDLSTGLRSSVLTLEGEGIVAAADGGEGLVWLLDSGNTLYRWDTGALPSGDDTVYSGICYTRGTPDLAGIAECRALAEQIGQRHGVEVLVWEDAIAVQPWDYHMTEEYQVPVLKQQLELLDRYLGNFPEGFLAQLSETCSGLTICLVREIVGDRDYSTLDDAAGLQFWEEDHAYIALSTVSSTEKSLYHELCHVIDTRVIAESNAYDQWEELNPSGFKYDYDYAANAVRNAGEYLRDAERCFIDTYSMSFPKEDRARVLEYAMTPGNESYFQSEIMQSKLKQLCLGFREAFGLKKSEETFLWEQYLNESLAYGK